MGLFIAKDGENEPTLWACSVAAHTVMGPPCDCDRPVALTRKCDVGNERAWDVLRVGAQVVGGLK